MIKERFTRVGFILAASGSAVGLGNIWKFPYIAGDNGGGVFVLVYLFTIAFIGISVFIAESYIGYKTSQNSVSAFETLAPENKNIWKFGGFTFVTALAILSFYVIVIGWLFQYVVLSFIHLPASVAEAESIFMTLLTQDISSQIFYFIIAFAIIAYTVSKGVKSGIERINKILMPTLILILLGLLAYSLSFQSFFDAFSFMFYPNFEKFHTESILVAVGHAFFTLSIGMAVIITYSASMSQKTDIVKSSVIVALLDTVIALIAGLVIFTILFNAGYESSQGAGLVFITLPALFYEFGFVGNILAISFFISLAFAGITSAVSILEPGVRYIEETKNINRKQSTYVISSIIAIVGIFALLSNTSSYAELLTIGSKNIFDWFDYLSSAILLPLGGIITAIFVGFIVDQNQLKTLLLNYMSNSVYKVWLFSIRYLVPFGVGIVMIEKIGLI
ncbi:sodium-dependent transporter [Arcobacter sp. FWKO B]|uniref:sodium-dependent transporter n=1 Tax=Arcobacter sp. FWKO B TaxID=2593672 RepID=UPI0018A4F8F5|nr:sodium-dependent transporter [Arcobacter sp. FWKO B]QOG11978.1 sodium-dependent transporter [Arcobacter sp. FWKO B]